MLGQAAGHWQRATWTESQADLLNCNKQEELIINLIAKILLHFFLPINGWYLSEHELFISERAFFSLCW